MLSETSASPKRARPRLTVDGLHKRFLLHGQGGLEIDVSLRGRARLRQKSGGTHVPATHSSGAQHCELSVHEVHSPAMHAWLPQSRQEVQPPPGSSGQSPPRVAAAAS